jgi:hypothetical protein
VDGGGFHNPDTLTARLATAEGQLRELESALAQPAPGPALDSQAWRHRAQIERQIGEAREALKRLASP